MKVSELIAKLQKHTADARVYVDALDTPCIQCGKPMSRYWQIIDGQVEFITPRGTSLTSAGLTCPPCNGIPDSTRGSTPH